MYKVFSVFALVRVDVKYSKLPVIHYPSTQNSQPINKNFKENFHFLWRYTKNICNMHMFTYHEVVLQAATSRTATALQYRTDESVILFHYTYPKSFVHQSTVSPGKTPTQQLKRKHVALTLYWVSAKVSLMQLPHPISHTCFLMGS
jgi:hypothetical protein